MPMTNTEMRGCVSCSFRLGRKCSFKSANNATLQDAIFARARPIHQAFSANGKTKRSNI